MVQVVCPNPEVREVVGLAWRTLELHKYDRVCRKAKQTIKVSYNLDPVFFDFNTKTEINEDSIEGLGKSLTLIIIQSSLDVLALKTYLEKYQLRTEYIDEGGFWGSRDENGTFNGVVGSFWADLVAQPSKIFMEKFREKPSRRIAG